MDANTTIAAGRVVILHYKLTLDDGQVVDSSEPEAPLSYLHGAGNIVPGLEKALDGRSAGDKLQVAVTPDEGYGQREENAVQQVDRSAFPPDAQVEAGIVFQALDQDDNPLLGTITAVQGSDVTIDFNHPLAGRNLHFEVEVQEVREATDEEREHGHVHGPGGAHH